MKQYLPNLQYLDLNLKSNGLVFQYIKETI